MALREKQNNQGIVVGGGSEAAIPAQHGYPCCKVCTVKSNSLSLVQFQTNRYSILVTVAEEKLTLKAFVDRVEISTWEKIVAVHRHCYGRHEDILDPLHYLLLLRERFRLSPVPSPSATGTGRKSLTTTSLPFGNATTMGQPLGSLSEPWSFTELS